jgi:hypothetical protein
MSIRHWLFSAVLFGASISGFSLSASAKEIAPNSADLQYSVSVPTMQIAINPGGGGCTGVETWDPVAGRCTEVEYIRNTVSVVQVSPSPATVASDGTVSTLSATVRDGLGRLAPAGVEVIWAATLGTLTTTTSFTNANGVALSAISSKTAGASTIYAKTTVSGNASTGVTFKSSAPVINNFTVTCNGQGANTICLDGNSNLFDRRQAVFSWSAAGATRFEVYGSYGLMYSGGGTSFDAYQQVSHGSYNTMTYTLRAYNGSAVTVKEISPRAVDVTENGQSG